MSRCKHSKAYPLCGTPDYWCPSCGHVVRDPHFDEEFGWTVGGPNCDHPDPCIQGNRCTACAAIFVEATP